MRAILASIVCLVCVLLAACMGPGPIEPDLDNPAADKAAALVAHLKDNPGDVRACADLLRLQMERADQEGARLTVEHVLHHSAADFRAWLVAAQYDRWQLDLLTAEKRLLKARDLAPSRVEPRVALAALYRDAALESDELAQREAAFHLADQTLRPNLLLDLVYARAAAGLGAAAREQALALAAGDVSVLVRARALMLASELALDASDEAACVKALLEARKLEPRDRSVIRFGARLAAALADPAPLKPLFDDVLATQEDPESRFAALFGLWTSAVRAALLADTDPFAPGVEALWTRLLEIDEAQPDTLARRYLLLAAHEPRKAEAERIRERLEALGFGAPAATSSPRSLLRLWRAEDCLRLGAARPCLDELEQLMVREPGMAALKLLRATALFVTRDDKRCLEYVEALLAQTGGKGDELLALKRQVMLRQGKAVELVREFESAEPRSQSDLWMQAVARFHTYRQP